MSSNPVVLKNAADAYVFKNAPTTNFDNNARLVARAAGSNLDCYTYIWFARPFPLGSTITNATLRLHQLGTESATHTVTVRRITSHWTNWTITWDHVPTVTSTGQVQVTKAGSPNGTEWSFDVTAMMQMVSDGTPFYGFVLTTDQDDYIVWTSSESVYTPFAGTQPSSESLKPVLELTWSSKPEAPTTLSPSGNRAVSLDKPTLRFDFTDLGGNTNLQAVQVQINPTNVWTSPAFDSGTVLTSDAQLDLSTTAYAGLAAGASTYWRVRVQDGSGLWSAWSLGAQFQRQTKGTLTITNPPISGLITESTPPITWTFTGRTQTAWLVYISPGDDTSVNLHSTGKVTGTQTSYTLPAGVITDDTSYNVHVWIWDEISRENTPNDGAFVAATRAFTFDYDATVDPVTSLTGTDLSPEPAVQLTWSRATAPDSFVIRRNGSVVASGLTPVELSTGGTNYAYTDRGADPNKPVTWRVDSVVNGKTSASNPTTTKTLHPVGVWLSDYSRDLSVQLFATGDQGDWVMGEEAETYKPVGAYRPIRITQAMRGFEGSVAGRIVDGGSGGMTLADQEAALYAMKSTPGRTYTLTLANHTLLVFIGNLIPGPLDNITRGKAVSFSFWQTGNYTYRAVL